MWVRDPGKDTSPPGPGTRPRAILCPRPTMRGNERSGGETSRSVWKVKLPKLRFDQDYYKAGKNEAMDGDRDDGNVFNFSETPTSKATGDGAKVPCSGQAKLSVLRTISKMREENQHIRQRLAALRQAG